MTNDEYAQQLYAAVTREQERAKRLKATADVVADKPPSVTREVDETAGRRMLYTLSGEIQFTADQDGVRGDPIVMLIPQDRAFVLTHYPVISWVPTTPSNASNLGRYSPIRTWPTATQQFTTSIDIIDISYELVDGGSHRDLQDATPVSGQLVSQGDNMVPLPVPTLFAPNTTVYLYPTYSNIAFAIATADPVHIATTQGALHVDLPGYCILI